MRKLIVGIILVLCLAGCTGKSDQKKSETENRYDSISGDYNSVASVMILLQESRNLSMCISITDTKM